MTYGGHVGDGSDLHTIHRSDLKLIYLQSLPTNACKRPTNPESTSSTARKHMVAASRRLLSERLSRNMGTSWNDKDIAQH